MTTAQYMDIAFWQKRLKNADQPVGKISVQYRKKIPRAPHKLDTFKRMLGVDVPTFDWSEILTLHILNAVLWEVPEDRNTIIVQVEELVWELLQSMEMDSIQTYYAVLPEPLCWRVIIKVDAIIAIEDVQPSHAD